MNISSDVFSVSNPSTISTSFSQELDSSSNPNPTNKNTSSNPTTKRKRNLPGTPDPDAEVIALSPKTLMATNRFLCEICNKGFQRDQNLQLHRRGHNLPWKLKQRANKDQIKKKVYLCPEKTCVHHDPSRALGDLTGIKKHFFRKHGEKKWKCEKCSKKYAVQSDWKAHSKTCGTREYKCDCGTLFSRKDSFITHRAFCDALAEESTRNITNVGTNNLNFNVNMMNHHQTNNLPHGFTNATRFPNLGSSLRPEFGGGSLFLGEHQQQKPRLSLWLDQQTNSSNQVMNNMDHYNSNGLFMPSNANSSFPDMMQQMSSSNNNNIFGSNYANLSLSPMLPPQPQSFKEEPVNISNKGDYIDINSMTDSLGAPSMSATALLQKAASMGSTKSNVPTTFFGNMNNVGVMNNSSSDHQNRSELHEAIFGNMNHQSSSGNSNFTRDFLGVGGAGDGGTSSFLRQEYLAKFAPMNNSAMEGLSHFENHH